MSKNTSLKTGRPVFLPGAPNQRVMTALPLPEVEPVVGGGERRRLSRGRTLVLGAVAAATLFAGIKGVADAGSGPDLPELKPGEPGTEVYTVKPGDTAWDIARAALPDDQNFQELAHDLGQQPDAQDGLHPGDELVVPVSSELEGK
jgi:hypothetical protein